MSTPAPVLTDLRDLTQSMRQHPADDIIASASSADIFSWRAEARRWQRLSDHELARRYPALHEQMLEEGLA